METKITDDANLCIPHKSEERETRLWFTDEFSKHGEFSGALIITDSNNLLSEWEGISIHLSTEDLIRLKNAINSHLEVIKLAGIQNIRKY